MVIAWKSSTSWAAARTRFRAPILPACLSDSRCWDKGTWRRQILAWHVRLPIRSSGGMRSAYQHSVISAEVTGVVGEADVLVLLPQRHDAVAEAEACRAAAQFMYLERIRRTVCDVY